MEKNIIALKEFVLQIHFNSVNLMIVNTCFQRCFHKNSERVAEQKKAPIRVIIGNPPYSIGQKSANDNAQNQSYPTLDNRIENTYAKESTAGLNKSLYDAYIKAFRWASDRLEKYNGGIICFVSNGAWLDGNSQDGFRKCLEREFSSIYVFNTRGNARTQGELRRKEAGNIFGGGSRTPIAITLLVKNPKQNTDKAIIHYHDIGDYLSREEKLAIVKKFNTVLNTNFRWKSIIPNEHGDWINQRNNSFESYIPIEPEKKFQLDCQSFFNTYAIGVSTNRDAWVYNFNCKTIQHNMALMIDFYNHQKDGYIIAKKKNHNLLVDKYIDTDPKKISWTRSLKNDISSSTEHKYSKKYITLGLYRPFCKQILYFDKSFIESPGLSNKIFPNKEIENYVICVTGIGASKDYSLIIANSITNLDSIEKSQCFPLYYYEERSKQSPSLFDAAGDSEYIKRDGISDFILERAKKQYGKNVTKEDIFYYVYGFLHSPEYRSTFANDLKKMLPRLPLVDEPREFWKFSKAGRELADLHINYESVEPHHDVVVNGDDGKFYTVEKMRFPSKDQKDTIIYNSKITISNIPAKANEYVVNGKSAIEWIMERYQVKIDKDSGIKNDPNDWAKEVGNPRYILDLLLSIINVSVKTVDIVNELPKLKFD